MLGRIFLRVDISTKKFITEQGYTIKDKDLPRISFATETILCVKFYTVDKNAENPLTPYSFNANALFSCRGDNDLNTDNDLMFLTEQMATEPPIWLADTDYYSGDKVKSSDGDWYACYKGGTSGSSEPNWNSSLGDTTNDGTVIWIRVANNDGVNQPGDFYDWDSTTPTDTTADPTLGQLSFRLQTNTQKFKDFVNDNLSVMIPESKRALIQFFVMEDGNINYSNILDSNFLAGGTLDADLIVPSPSNPDYLTATQISQIYMRKDLFKLSSPVSSTILAGDLIVNNGVMNVIPESGYEDDLETISGGSDGLVIILETIDFNVITIKNTGNIVTPKGLDITFDSTSTVTLIYDGSFWKVISQPPAESLTEEEVRAIATEQAIIYG